MSVIFFYKDLFAHIPNKKNNTGNFSIKGLSSSPTPYPYYRKNNQLGLTGSLIKKQKISLIFTENHKNL